MLSGPEKVAILVANLDKEQAKKIINSLSNEEKIALEKAQATLQNIDEIEKKKVIESFIKQVKDMDNEILSK